MPVDAQTRFIAAQIAGLAALGLNPAALAREESLLRAGFAQVALLAAWSCLPLPSREGRNLRPANFGEGDQQ